MYYVKPYNIFEKKTIDWEDWDVEDSPDQDIDFVRYNNVYWSLGNYSSLDQVNDLFKRLIINVYPDIFKPNFLPKIRNAKTKYIDWTYKDPSPSTNLIKDFAFETTTDYYDKYNYIYVGDLKEWLSKVL